MEVPPEEWARINKCGIALRKVKRIQIHDAFLDQHLGFLDAVRAALNHVPLGRDEGGHQGWWLETLQSERLALERDLSALDKEAGSSGLRLCAVQAGGSEQPPTGTDEVLQTMTVSLDVVRGDLEAWKPAMRAEYGSLINETSAIQPVKFGDLDQSQVEFVPGKLVCTVKPGLNGGTKKVSWCYLREYGSIIVRTHQCLVRFGSRWNHDSGSAEAHSNDVLGYYPHRHKDSVFACSSTSTSKGYQGSNSSPSKDPCPSGHMQS